MFNFFKKKGKECIATATWSSNPERCSNCKFYKKVTKRSGFCEKSPITITNTKSGSKELIKYFTANYYHCDDYIRNKQGA